MQELNVKPNQTAIDWLIEQLIAKSKENNPNNFAIQIYFESNGILISSAKRIEKQQIIDAYGKLVAKENEILTAEQYYNETFNPK